MAWRRINCILWLVLAGCGSVTDVGNPTLDELVGVFQQPSSGGSGDNQSDTASSGGTACRADATKTKQVADTGVGNQVRFLNFLSYSDSTADIVADYTASTGQLALTVNDASAVLHCQGSASSTAGQIAVSLTCEVTVPAQEQCSLSYVKVSR